MGLNLSRRSCCLRTSKELTQAGRGPRIGTRTPGWLLVFLLSASVAYGAGAIGTPTPPPAPRVPPIISGDYPTDLDGNRISDALESATGPAGEFSIASDELVEVELIFKEPVTQGQIDEGGYSLYSSRHKM